MRGDSRPPILTPAKPREGAAAVAAAATGRPSSPPAPPPPRPLPAGRFADRPNRQKLRARGPLGAFLLWCELPMVGAGAGAGTQAKPNEPRRRARSPGRQAERRAGGHRRRPQPQLGHTPGLCSQWREQGRGRRRGGGWRASRRLRPPGPGRPAEPPRPERSGNGKACPGGEGG